MKRILKGIGLLLALLFVAALAFREWCVWRLPSMEREVDAAWKDYAGVAYSEIPQRFPSVETNDEALKLEAAAAKLGICLAPTETGKTDCPRNAPTDAARKEFEALSSKDAKGESHSLLTDYLNAQMERPDPAISVVALADVDRESRARRDGQEDALLIERDGFLGGRHGSLGHTARQPFLAGIFAHRQADFAPAHRRRKRLLCGARWFWEGGLLCEDA